MGLGNRLDVRDQKEVRGWDETQVPSVCVMDEVSPFIAKRKTRGEAIVERGEDPVLDTDLELSLGF